MKPIEALREATALLHFVRSELYWDQWTVS